MDEFARHASSKDGHRHDCRGCVADGKAKHARELTAEQKARDKALRAKAHRRNSNRRAVSDWQKRNPRAVAARAALHKAVKQGRVPKAERCQAAGCNAERVEGHHFNYERPLDVGWFCPKHHRRLHAGVRFDLKLGIDPLFAGLPELF